MPPPVGGESTGAGVRIDPQLIYALPFGAGLVGEWWYPLAIGPAGVTTPAGIVLVVLGVLLAGAAVRRFRAARTTLQPWEPTTALVSDGPFRFSRNPVYLAYSLVYLGAALWIGSLWPVVLFPAVLLAMMRLVIRREERYLADRFGDRYRDYCRRVRRWL